MVEKVADLTMTDLETLIAQMIDERLAQRMLLHRPRRSMRQVLAEVDALPRYTTPPGSDSVEALLREDRER